MSETRETKENVGATLKVVRLSCLLELTPSTPRSNLVLEVTRTFSGTMRIRSLGAGGADLARASEKGAGVGVGLGSQENGDIIRNSLLASAHKHQGAGDQGQDGLCLSSDWLQPPESLPLNQGQKC